MRTLIIGAGAIGCLLGAKLALTSNSVTLVGRSDFAEAVRLHGLQLVDDAGTHEVRNLYAVTSVEEAFSEAYSYYDLAIMTVKSFDTASALEELIAAADPEEFPVVLSMQNGIGNEALIASQIGADRVIAGTVTTPVSVLAPGKVRVDRPSYNIALGPWSHEVSMTLLDASHHAFAASGFFVKIYHQANSIKWTKLLMNMVGNATSAILDQPPSETVEYNDILDLEISAWREAFAVMRADRIGAVNLGGYPLRLLSATIGLMPNAILRPLLRQQLSRARGEKPPSLLLDLRQGKTKSEMDYLNGAVVQAGQRLNIATPVNAVLYETFTHLLTNPDDRASWRKNPDLLVSKVETARQVGLKEAMSA